MLRQLLRLVLILIRIILFQPFQRLKIFKTHQEIFVATVQQKMEAVKISNVVGCSV